MAQVAGLLRPGDAGRVPIQLCLDVGHQCVLGTAVPSGTRTPGCAAGRRRPVVQLQQTDAEADHHWPFTAQYNAAGRIDARRVLEALGDAAARARARGDPAVRGRTSRRCSPISAKSVAYVAGGARQ